MHANQLYMAAIINVFFVFKWLDVACDMAGRRSADGMGRGEGGFQFFKPFGCIV